MHAAPLAFNSCSPPARTSTQLTAGTPDANGLPAASTGSVRLVHSGGDIYIFANVTDVRSSGTFADYAGELRLNATVRATDRLSPPPDGDAGTGTVVDIDFGPTIPCAATPTSAGLELLDRNIDDSSDSGLEPDRPTGRFSSSARSQ